MRLILAVLPPSVVALLVKAWPGLARFCCDGCPPCPLCP